MSVKPLSLCSLSGPSELVFLLSTYPLSLLVPLAHVCVCVCVASRIPALHNCCRSLQDSVCPCSGSVYLWVAYKCLFDSVPGTLSLSWVLLSEPPNVKMTHVWIFRHSHCLLGLTLSSVSQALPPCAAQHVCLSHLSQLNHLVLLMGSLCHLPLSHSPAVCPSGSFRLRPPSPSSPSSFPAPPMSQAPSFWGLSKSCRNGGLEGTNPRCQPPKAGCGLAGCVAIFDDSD